eukprot:9023640-Prorocentrum_lima.AAC.1
MVELLRYLTDGRGIREQNMLNVHCIPPIQRAPCLLACFQSGSVPSRNPLSEPSTQRRKKRE